MIAISNKYYNEFRSESVDFPIGNVGDIIVIDRDIEIRNFAISDYNQPIKANVTASLVGSYWLFDPRGGFKSFKVGDVIEHKNYNNNTAGAPAGTGGILNVVAKLDDNTIQVDGDVTGGLGNDVDLGSSIFNNKTAITALKYKWNFIENDDPENFNSKIDGSEQLLDVTNIDSTSIQTSGALTVGQTYIITDYNAGDDFTNVANILIGTINTTGCVFIATGTTPTTYTNGSTLGEATQMNFVGYKPYQTGRAFIAGAGINTVGYYGFKFKIIHQTKILPVFLSSQYTDFTNNVKPDYFQNTKCLKDVHFFEGLYDYNDPNRETVQSFNEVEGNTGWFNENFNNGNTNYWIDSIVFKKPDTTVIPGILFSASTETTVEITVKNIINDPFSNNNTKFTLNFVKAPEDESEYQNNGKTFDENFFFDHAFNTVGAASVDGDNFATSYQVLKDIAATWVDAETIKITAQIAMHADVLTHFNSLDSKRYFFFVGVQNHTLATIAADRVNLFSEIAEFYESETDPGMIVFDQVFLRHYETDPLTEGVTDLEAFVEDELVAYVNIDIDSTGRTTDQFGNPQYIQMVSAEAKIKAKNTVTLEEFDLDTSGIINLLGYPIINGNTFVQYSQPRQFHIPSAEIRKNILFERKPLLDAGSYSHFIMQFPFIIRWEYFFQNAAVDYDFFNISQPNNGLNHKWYRIATALADWKIYFECKLKARKVVTINGVEYPGINLNYSLEKEAKLWDYESRPLDHYLPHSIKTFTYPGGVELYDVVNNKRFIQGFDYTKVEATFERPLAVPIDPLDVEIRLWIEEYEVGGRDGSRRISTIHPLDNDTWFKSITTNNLADLQLNQVAPLIGGNDTITANCLIDHQKIPLTCPVFAICARLYDKATASPLARITEDGQQRITEDSQDREIEV